MIRSLAVVALAIAACCTPQPNEAGYVAEFGACLMTFEQLDSGSWEIVCSTLEGDIETHQVADLGSACGGRQELGNGVAIDWGVGEITAWCGPCFGDVLYEP